MILKPVTRLLLGILLLTSVETFGQSSATEFVASTSYPPVVMTQQKGIEVLYLQGSIGKSAAFSLIFKNTTNQMVTFRWVLKDNKEHVVYSNKTTQVMGGQALDKDNRSDNEKMKFSFVLSDGMTANDYKIEIR